MINTETENKSVSSSMCVDVDVLSLRSFSKHRAAIEKEYGQVSEQNLFLSTISSVSVIFTGNAGHVLISGPAQRQSVGSVLVMSCDYNKALFALLS